MSDYPFYYFTMLSAVAGISLKTQETRPNPLAPFVQQGDELYRGNS